VANPVPDPVASHADAYRLGVGDVLAITVWDHPELTGAGLPSGADNLDGKTGPPPATFVIDQQGQLHFPFAGAVPLAGLTREAARDRLAQRLARYFRAPRVTVAVMAYRSQRVYVDGQVRTPGPQPINDIPMTVLEALNRAGGLLPTADQSRITVERAGRRYRIDLVAAMRGELPQSPQLSASAAPGQPYPAALLLADGDVVRAPPRDENKVFVGGEVLSPRALTMHDGRLTRRWARRAGSIRKARTPGRSTWCVGHGCSPAPRASRWSTGSTPARPARWPWPSCSSCSRAMWCTWPPRR